MHYSISLMNELAGAFSKNNFVADDIEALKNFPDLVGLKDLIRGKAKLSYPSHLIDTERLPVFPENYTLINSNNHGVLDFSYSKMELYFAPNQEKGDGISGLEVLETLDRTASMNAATLHDLIINPKTISSRWEGYILCFWGSTFLNQKGASGIMCLMWIGREWIWVFRELTEKFNKNTPAVQLRSLG